MAEADRLHLSIIYDNTSIMESLQADWGFSCFIRGLEKSILFDTGAKGLILNSNMEKLAIRPGDIDCVVLSHYHKDHTGGLSTILHHNPKIKVWLPEFFPVDFKENITSAGASILEVNDQRKICEGAFTTGVIEGWIKEQSLVLDTTVGLVVVTGCAHPRLINIFSKVKDMFGKDIHMVLGGFHLAGFQKNEIQEVIEKSRELGVKKIGPCHCTGELAHKMFAAAYKADFITVGAGTEIVVR